MPFAFQARGAGRRPLLTTLFIATVLAAVMYQGKGYPEEDSVDGKRMTTSEHIASLMRLCAETLHADESGHAGF